MDRGFETGSTLSVKGTVGALDVPCMRPHCPRHLYPHGGRLEKSPIDIIGPSIASCSQQFVGGGVGEILVDKG